MLFSFFSFLALMASVAYSWLPDWNMPQNWINTVQLLLTYALKFDGVFPVVTLFEVVGMIIIFEAVIFIAKIVLSIYNFLRGSGSLDFGL